MDPYVVALADERAAYARSQRPDRAIAVDEELARLGFCVDTDGKLQKVSTAVTAPKSKAKTEGGELESRPASAPENRPANAPKTAGGK